MIKDKILEQLFEDKEMQTIPIGCQSTAVTVFDRVLQKLVEENEYATISELLS